MIGPDANRDTSNIDKTDGILDVIDHVYAAAIDPMRYDELQDVWVERLERHWTASSQPRLLMQPHLFRAMDLVADTGDRLQEQLAAVIDDAGGIALIASTDGFIQTLSPGARNAYGVDIGDMITALPIDEVSAKVLKESLVATGADAQERLVRLCKNNEHRTILISLSLCQTVPDDAFVLIRSSDTIWSEQIGQLLKEAFDLTTAEIEIAQMISDGIGVAHVAERRNSSVATVRKQLGTIYDKTGVRGLAELVRMILGVAAANAAMDNPDLPQPVVIEPTVRPRFEPCYPHQEHCHIFQLADGRRFSYARFGMRGGRPVVQLHDYYSGNTWLAKMAHDAADRGLDIIIPARARYDETDPYLTKVNTFDQFANDLYDLLDHLDVDRFVLLARANGAMFIPPILDRMSGRIRGMVGVSATAAPKELADIEALPAYYRFLLKLRLNAGMVLFEFLARLRRSQYVRHGPKWYLKNSLLHDVQPDLDLLNDPEVFDALEKGLHFCASRGYRASLGDFKDLVENSWQRSINIRVPSIGIYGSEDPLPRAQYVKAVADAGAPIEVRIAEGAGQLLFYSHYNMMFDAIDEHFARNES